MTYAGPRTLLPMLGRGLTYLVVLGALAAAAHFGYGRYRAARAAAAPPQYFTQPASVGSVVETALGSGSFAPASTENVAPQVSGTVTQVDAAVGQSIAAGQVVFQLADTSGLAQQVASAQAAVGQAQRQLEQLETPGIAVDPRTIQGDQLRVQQSQISLDQATATLQAAQAAAAAAAVVSTPVAGTVQAVAVSSGQQVAAGAALATLQPAGSATVSVSVPQAELAYLGVGTAATVTAPALGLTLTGSVSALGPAPSASSATGASGSSASGSAGSSAATSGLYPLVVTLEASQDLPQGADVTVGFTPQGNPPATDTWTDGGTVAYPAPLTLAAGQAGTVSGLPAVGAALTAGQQAVTVTPASPPAALTQAQSGLQQAQLNLQGAQLTLQQAQAPLPASADQLAAQASQLSSAEQSLQLDQQTLSELTVRSPVAGIVQSVAIQPGDQLQANAAALTLQSAGPLQAVAYVDELDISEIKTGQSATLTIGAFPNQQFTGTVTGISPTSTTQVGVTYYGVVLSIAKPPANLRSGMTLNATILIQQVTGTLRVPTWAVTARGTGGQGLVRVLQAGRPVPVLVTLGLRSTQWTQILSGLKAGQAVIAGDAAAASTTGAGIFFVGGGGRGGFGGAGLAVRSGA